MFRFEYQHHLYWLISIVVFIGLFLWTWQLRKRLLSRFGDTLLVQQLITGYSRFKSIFKFILCLLSLAAIIVAWANPQRGAKLEQVEATATDVIFALDISYSMLAEDVPPNRMERAKRFTEEMITALKGERMGLILFAGNAYLQTPLTSDHTAVSIFVKSTNPYQATTQGTAIGDAIQLAETTFEEGKSKGKALIIISDGETHDTETKALAEKAKDQGMLIFTIGVGTETGSFIPIETNGRVEYKQDLNGQAVTTKLNPAILKATADAADGQYFNLLQGSPLVLETLKSEISKLERRKVEQLNFEEYESYFQYFVALAMLLLLLEFIIPYRKSKFAEGRDLFG